MSWPEVTLKEVAAQIQYGKIPELQRKAPLPVPYLKWSPSSLLLESAGV